MVHFSLPGWVSDILQYSIRLPENSLEFVSALKEKLKRLNHPDPLISVVIPAWNEEEGILHTLISIANTDTKYPTELIVVDNNSTDGTADLLKQLGVRVVFEKEQGIGHARRAGLMAAKGKFVLTGDSDSLYPPGWISAMVKPLLGYEESKIFCVHGSYSFLPGAKTPRWMYAIYEIFRTVVINKHKRTRPYMNVLGFTCGFVREMGIEVDGYNLPIQRKFRGTPGGDPGAHAIEDGMMALRLMEHGGKICSVMDATARVWTSDRRIEIDGGFKKATILRIKKHLLNR